MNQFKRAKQNGQKMESITDLKTAGVAETENIEKQQTDNINNEEINQHIAKTISTDNIVIPEAQYVTDGEKIILSKETPVSLNEEEKTEIINDIRLSEDIVHAEIPMNITQASAYNEPIVITQSQNMQQQISVSAPPAQSVQQYIEYDTTYTETNATKTKTSKKNVPNMFVQKSESKSIRKSLVLRPSSVKIAENYCSKNGGSFNELIQILLDKFIEEYGL